MRNFALSAAMAVTALTLAACSQGTEDNADTSSDSAMANSDAGDGGAQDMTAGAVLDANSATAEQLASANGVSPELADAIVAGQPYSSVVDLNAVLLKTLSPEEASAVLANVFVPVNLNTASKEELKLIPGMTERMEHEFEEYRPYEGMAEFDREIGKYVDEAEVARFRNYVTL